MQEVLDHLETLGRPARHICFVEPKYAGSGPDEQEALARYFHDRYKLKVMHADPRELTLAKGEVYYNGEAVDLVYRDYAVADLIDLEKEGVGRRSRCGALFKQNRIISSIAAELDQKSCWEILTDPQFTQSISAPTNARCFAGTSCGRGSSPPATPRLPDGQTGDLLEYVRRERESLVLKPNRAYGGTGVVIGHLVEQAEWEAALEKALADQERWVVQQAGQHPGERVPGAGAGRQRCIPSRFTR